MCAITARVRQSGGDTVLWLSPLDEGTSVTICHTRSFAFHSRQSISRHMMDVPSASLEWFKKGKKERWFLHLNHCNSKNCIRKLWLLRAFIITPLKKKKKKPLSSELWRHKRQWPWITRSWANSPGERIQPLHRRIQLNPASSSELDAVDIKMNMTCLLRGL